ncbi:MAG: Smr/MutS family protein [Bacteroidetes bacterium]|nr:Smr/MutS family protein [Bacteroidota bacterium]MBS1973035.1 Smr/MutS family protein [Bacteroidota bacterium]
MKFQVGDTVLVLHSNEEGEVVDIINNKMVMIDVRGVKFPAYIDQLDFPYFRRFTEKKPAPKQKKHVDELPREKKANDRKAPSGVWLSFLPVSGNDEFGDEVVEAFKIYLINNTNDGLKFFYRVSYLRGEDFDIENELFAFKDFYLHDIPFENLNDNPVFEFEFALKTPDKKKADYFETNFRLKAKQVFAKIEDIRKKGEATFSYKLFDEYPDRVREDKLNIQTTLSPHFKIYEASKSRQHLPPARSVVDLHIEKLADDWKRMSNFEMLTLQLKEFEKYYDLAVAHHLPSIIFIHGIGSGKLRDEIHELLRLKKEVKTFVNQYHPAYGYGATEVYLLYK